MKSLEDELRAMLGVKLPHGLSPVEHRVISREPADGFELQRIEYPADDGEIVPALLFVPEKVRLPSAGVVVFHQHNAEWHLGKSEVGGLAGNPLQAFGPMLAARGAFVLAPDALCFEDRRRQTNGTSPHPDDDAQHQREFAYRLVSGDTLARKVVQDAITAVSAIRAMAGVAPDRVGALGHSFGGHTVLFLAAVDPRVMFACSSGAAGSFRARMDQEMGIELDQLVLGIANRLDYADLVGLAAPRPLLVVAGEDDRYAPDAEQIVIEAMHAYEAAGKSGELQWIIDEGGHAMTEERRNMICSWVTAVAGLRQRCEPDLPDRVAEGQ